MKRFKTIGVLGGMGPCATAHFYQLLLTQAQKNYKAVQDNDYPHIILNSLALDGSSECGMEENKQILSQISEGIKSLEKAGAEFIVIPCNSVHNAIKKLRKASKVPIISIIEAVSDKVEKSDSKKVLVLSSETTRKYGLYGHLAKKGIKLVRPDKKFQKVVTKLIFAVMGSSNWSNPKSEILRTINKLSTKRKIDSVILGCTELPLAIQNKDSSVKLYDSLKILAQASLEYAEDSKTER